MKLAILLVGWCVLWVLSWPLALALLFLAPLLWILTLPIRLVLRLLGLIVDGVFALLRAVFLLPARLLGHRST